MLIRSIYKIICESLDHFDSLNDLKPTIYSFKGRAENAKIGKFGFLLISAQLFFSGNPITHS